ncbi:glycosyl hydrolase family 25, partial [Streptococcus anginosus]|nr:glycosyl hydrolase family 25 [Streptococcus anginosus]
NDYPLGVAQYNTMSPQYGFVDRDLYGSLKYWKVITLFQNTSTGHISGWNGGLDLSIFYGDKATWNKLVASSMEVDEEMAWHPEVKWNQ